MSEELPINPELMESAEPLPVEDLTTEIPEEEFHPPVADGPQVGMEQEPIWRQQAPPPPPIWSDPVQTAGFKTWFQEQTDYYRDLLEPTFQNCIGYWQRYLLQREDPREEDQMWRAFVTDPSPNQVIEVVCQQLTEIFGSADPLVQGEGVGMDDAQEAQAIERNVDVVLRKNAIEVFLDDLFRHVLIQGFQPCKITWGRKTITIRRNIGESDYLDFERAVREAEAATKTTAPTGDLDAFNLWRKLVYDSTRGKARVPEIPVPGPVEIDLYNGPLLERPSINTLLFDPQVADWQKQILIAQRYVVSPRWIEERTDWTDAMEYTEGKPWCTADPNKPFWGPAVVQGLSAGSHELMIDWDQQLAQMLGYDPQSQTDPALKDSVELYECWMPTHPTIKKAWVLNRETGINKETSYLEYEHGMVPWVNLRNVPLEGCLGMSELKPSMSSFAERERLRELFLDAVLIEVMPILVKHAASGIDDEDIQGWHPGMVLTSNRPDGLTMLRKDNGAGIRDILSAIGFLRGEQDDTHATGGQVRGREAPIGRVTADEARGRLSQALLRQKAKVRRWSAELQPVVYQILGLLAQFADSEDLVNIGGVDPFIKIPKQRFYDALMSNYKLRGPLDHLNKIENADALMAFGKTFGPFVRPEEMRNLMLVTLRQLGIKDEILTPQGTAETVMAMGMPQGGMVPGQPQLPPGQEGAPPGQPAPPQIPPGNGGPPQ